MAIIIRPRGGDVVGVHGPDRTADRTDIGTLDNGRRGERGRQRRQTLWGQIAIDIVNDLRQLHSVNRTSILHGDIKSDLTPRFGNGRLIGAVVHHERGGNIAEINFGRLAKVLHTLLVVGYTGVEGNRVGATVLLDQRLVAALIDPSRGNGLG